MQKIQSSRRSFCALQGSACVKALCNMLMKLTPGHDFYNVFHRFGQAKLSCGGSVLDPSRSIYTTGPAASL
jgi:hypothetical protein